MVITSGAVHLMGMIPPWGFVVVTASTWSCNVSGHSTIPNLEFDTSNANTHTHIILTTSWNISKWAIDIIAQDGPDQIQVLVLIIQRSWHWRCWCHLWKKEEEIWWMEELQIWLNSWYSFYNCLVPLPLSLSLSLCPPPPERKTNQWWLWSSSCWEKTRRSPELVRSHRLPSFLLTCWRER